jgi:hypothetical protein
MAKQIINIGAVPNDGTGSNLRAGATIVNDNFTELYTALGDGSSITLTATPTELNLLSGVTTVITPTSSNTLTNKDLSSLTNTFPTFNVIDDSSSSISIALGGNLNVVSNAGITTTVSGGNTITIALDSDVLTETSTNVLSNKTIAASSNTITGLTNTNLSGSAGITNANIANSFITISDEASTVGTVNLGDRLEFLTGNGIDTVVVGNTLTISTSSIPNSSLSNPSVAIGTSTITLGAAATTSIANLNLTGSSALSGTGTIDLTGSGNRIRFNFANTGAFPNATTYQGQFAVATGVAKAYFADSGGYNEIATENSSVGIFTDVDISSSPPVGKQTLSWVAATGRFVPATVGAVTKHTGDGSTTGFTIVNLYNVNNILVFVNGLCLVPTDDYTVSGTTLSFILAPSASAEIVIRYLG